MTSEDMLLAIDIGNSTVSLGMFDGQTLMGHWRLTTDVSRTEDEYAELTLGMLEHGKIDPGQISAAILSTVVPALTPTFVAVAQRLFGRPPMIVSTEMDTGLTLSYRNPADLGTDRLLNAVAAYARYRTDVIAVDLGTATTFSVVTAAGEFLGGAIAAGLGTSAEAMATCTARLPKVDLRPPPAAIGRDTTASLQSGLVLGHAGMVDSLVARLCRDLGRSANVIATGGLAAVIAPISQTIQEVRPFLTLEGLELLYRRSGRSR
jgi:type III pantothenate kinase